jgi:hypothetical protein
MPKPPTTASSGRSISDPFLTGHGNPYALFMDVWIDINFHDDNI